jgi:CheY-specific phosphatase CheX
MNEIDREFSVGTVTKKEKMRAELDEKSLISANSHFWEQMLSMTLEPVPFTDLFCVGTFHLLASVELTGMWKGRIEVRLDEKLAFSATAAMLMQPVEHVTEADMLDAIGEIANMVAGAIKSSLPRPTNMTTPTSGIEPAGFCGMQRTENTLLVGFRHTDGDLMVRVWEQE